jgi:hypothetical protein
VALADPAIVELHRLESSPEQVIVIEGEAYRLSEGDAKTTERIVVPASVRIGETILVEPNARVILEHRVLSGGKRGRAHAFVANDAFRSQPNMADVPKLLDQLLQIEKQMEKLGDDPLTSQKGPMTPFERAMAADFCRNNVVLEAARMLPEELARSSRTVCLFFCDESAFVAMHKMSIAKVRAVMEALGRPLNPHLVDDEVVDELLDRVYAPLASTPLPS